MFLVVSRFLVPKGYGGLAVFPFIFLATPLHKRDSVFVNHERIHLRQQVEMLILPFFIWYLVEFAIGILRFRNISRAYRNISFEREAYAREREPEYLRKRPFWNFIGYLRS